MTSLDELDLFSKPSDEVVVGSPRKCRHPKESRGWLWPDGIISGVYHPTAIVACARCQRVLDPTKARRGKQSRNYGNRAELAVARTYGGEKIGMAGGPVDVRGKDWNTQVKTHRRPPPREWTSAFNAMAANRERLPRLLLRFVMGPGVAPDDYMVVPAKAWLDWFGRDE